MSNPYVEIFRAPGSFAFSLSGLIARCPLAMNTLSIVTMISLENGRYGLASSVATVYAVCNAILAPQISRLADRFGQTRIAIPATIIAVCAMLLLILAARLQGPAWILFLCAACIGFMPSFGAFVRARWSRLFHGSLGLHTAFAYESTIDETVFMLGPVLVIFLATHFFPEAGLMGSALLLAGGATLFCMQKKTEPGIIRSSKNTLRSRPVIFMLPIAVVIATLLATGAIFGTAEVTSVAFAKQQGNPAASMWPLSAYALGSFIVGLIYGGLRLKMPLVRQFIAAISIAALTTLPLLWVDSTAKLTLVLFIAGAACSPTIIIAMKLVESLVPPEKLTEGMTWAMTGMTIGFAVGIALAGHMIDRFGIKAGFFISIGSGFLALALILIFHRFIKKAKAARAG